MLHLNEAATLLLGLSPRTAPKAPLSLPARAVRIPRSVLAIAAISVRSLPLIAHVAAAAEPLGNAIEAVWLSMLQIAIAGDIPLNDPSNADPDLAFLAAGQNVPVICLKVLHMPSLSITTMPLLPVESFPDVSAIILLPPIRMVSLKLLMNAMALKLLPGRRTLQRPAIVQVGVATLSLLKAVKGRHLKVTVQGMFAVNLPGLCMLATWLRLLILALQQKPPRL